jgi:hypothetical protein
VALLSDAPKATKPRHKVFDNTAAGHWHLLAWLQLQTDTPVHACLEATRPPGQTHRIYGAAKMRSK